MNLKDCMQSIFMGLRQTNWKTASIPRKLKRSYWKDSRLDGKGSSLHGNRAFAVVLLFSEQKYRLHQNAEDLEIDYRQHQIVFSKEELTVIIDSIETRTISCLSSVKVATLPTYTTKNSVELNGKFIYNRTYNSVGLKKVSLFSRRGRTPSRLD